MCLIIKAAWKASSVCSARSASLTKQLISGSSINSSICTVAPSDEKIEPKNVA